MSSKADCVRDFTSGSSGADKPVVESETKCHHRHLCYTKRARGISSDAHRLSGETGTGKLFAWTKTQ
jgi:hypothetical protein